MTKHCALSGGPPGGCFASDAAVFSPCRTLRAPIRPPFFPCFTAYPRAGVCKSVVYGRILRPIPPGFALKISRWRVSKICEPVPCIPSPSARKNTPPQFPGAGYAWPIVVGGLLKFCVEILALTLHQLLRR